MTENLQSHEGMRKIELREEALDHIDQLKAEGIRFIVPVPYSSNMHDHGPKKGQARLSLFSALSTIASVKIFDELGAEEVFLVGESTFGDQHLSTSELMIDKMQQIGKRKKVNGRLDVVPAPNLNNTPFQVEALAGYQKSEGHSQDPYLLVAWDFHIPRIQEYAKAYGLNARFLSIEDVMRAYYPNYNEAKFKSLFDAFTARENSLPIKILGKRRGEALKFITKFRGATVNDIRLNTNPDGTRTLGLVDTTGKKRMKQATETSEQESVPEHFDALVVLGKNIGVDYSPARIRNSKYNLSVHSKLNVIAAGDLYAAGKTNKIIFSTGHTAGADFPSEAAAMREYLKVTHPQIPDGDVILEENSLDTWENAKEVKKVLEKRGFQTVGLLTVGFHLGRARMLFENEGIKTTPFSTDAVLSERNPKFAATYNRIPLVKKEDQKELVAFAIQSVPGGKQVLSAITHRSRR